MHITKFLQSQGRFLETLKLVFNQRMIRQNHQMFWGRQQNQTTEVLEWRDFSIISLAWNKLTALKKLAFRFTKTCKDEQHVEIEKLMVMIPNLNINEIVIHSAGCRHLPWRLLKYLLQASPNVEKVFIFYLTKDVLQFIALKMLKVRKLSCDLMENGTGVFFEELKALQPGVNKTMVIKGREETTEEEQQERNNWENNDVDAVGFPLFQNFEVDDSGSELDDSDVEYATDDDDDVVIIEPANDNHNIEAEFGFHQWEP